RSRTSTSCSPFITRAFIVFAISLLHVFFVLPVNQREIRLGHCLIVNKKAFGYRNAIFFLASNVPNEWKVGWAAHCRLQHGIFVPPAQRSRVSWATDLPTKPPEAVFISYGRISD